MTGWEVLGLIATGAIGGSLIERVLSMMRKAVRSELGLSEETVTVVSRTTNGA